MQIFLRLTLLFLFLIPAPAFAGHNEGVGGLILRGPILGSPAPHSVTLWVQASHPMSLRMRVISREQTSWDRGVLSAPVSLSPENRLMGKLHIKGLSPDTIYRYRLETKTGVVWSAENASFRTPPEAGEPTHLLFAAGSGANHWIDPQPKVWKAIAADQVDLFVALGDTPYADGQLWYETTAWEIARKADRKDKDLQSRSFRSEAASLLRRKAREAIPIAYEHFRECPGFSLMSSQSFWVATWDDHDTGINNGDLENPLQEIALENFKAFTPNPSFGLKEAPGAFWKLRWGDIDIFLLDDQSFRTPTVEALADASSATILGRKQLQWLMDGLKKSRATFKIIVSGSPFNNNSRKDDSWISYPRERKKLLDFIVAHGINGIVLLSGDVHRSEVFALPWLEEHGGYPLYEVVSSPLFQRARSCGQAVENRSFCSGSTDHGIRELYALFEADTTKKDPSLMFEIKGLEGEVLYSQTLHASQLRWSP